MRGAGEARVQLQREGHILLGADGRAAGGVRVLGPGVLPEAEAHGAGQDARARARAPRRAHAPAHRGPLARRRPAPRRDGAGLPHRIRRQVRENTRFSIRLYYYVLLLLGKFNVLI